MTHEMTVEELIMFLEDCDQEALVRIASQPAYPFENTLDRSRGPVIEMQPASEFYTDEDFDGDDDDFDLAADDGPKVVYLIEGAQIGYLPDDARQQIGW